MHRQEELLQSDPSRTDFILDLAQSYSNFGVLLRNRGKLVESLERLNRSVQMLSPLIKKHPYNASVANYLARALVNRANTLTAAGRPEEAMKSLRTAADELEALLGLPAPLLRLTVAPEAYLAMRRDLSACYVVMGQIHGNAGQSAKALSWYRKARETLKEAASQNQSNWDIQDLMSDVIGKAGDQHMLLGEFDEADAHHAETIRIRRDLLRQFPDSPDRLSDLGAALNNLAYSYTLRGRWTDALDHVREAIEYQRRARELNPEHSTYRVFLRNHLMVIADVYVHLEESDQAATAAREWSGLMLDESFDQFATGRVLARCAGLAPAGTKAKGFASEAIEHLERAIALGFSDPVSLSEDTAFDALRHNRQFQELLMELRDRAMPNGLPAFAPR
jgi:tetratricopeptide (TPR) repeat protein